MGYKILLGPDRVILDATNETTNLPVHYSSALAKITASDFTHTEVDVDNLPSNFAIGHALSADNTSCTGRSDSHSVYTIPSRRGNVVRWAQSLVHSPAFPLYCFDAMEWDVNAQTNERPDYRGAIMGIVISTLVAAKHDANLSDDNKWFSIEGNLDVTLKYWFEQPMIWRSLNIASANAGTRFYAYQRSGGGASLATPATNSRPVMNAVLYLDWAKSVVYPS